MTVDHGDAERKRRARAIGRDLKPRPVRNPRRRRRCENDDPRFLRTYFPDTFYNPFTSAQEEFIVDCGRAMTFGTCKAKAMPRGSGKSTIVKYLQMKQSLYRQLRFPLILGATTTKSRQILRDIKAKLRSLANKALHEDFPFEADVIRYVAPAPARANNVTWGGLPVHVEWGPDHFIMPSLPGGRGKWARAKYGIPKDWMQVGSIVMCLAYSSDTLQGLNVYDIRPDFVMADDMDSRDSLTSEHGLIAGKIEECLDKTVAGLGGQNRRLGRVFICTITSRRSAAYKYTDRKQKPAWDGDRTPAIVEWPTAKELWEKYVELRNADRQDDKYGRKARDFYVAHFDEMNAGAVLSNAHNYNAAPLEDGEPEHLSALQKCYDYIADEGMESFLTECQNDPPEDEHQLVAQVTVERMLKVVGEREQKEVDSTVDIITRGVDIRKIQVHYADLAKDSTRHHQIVDYDVRNHGTKRTTVEQAESLILENLRELGEWWLDNPCFDERGMLHPADLTLVDKGWVGTWREDGERKQWATQPVETFCMEMGLRHFLPTKAAPNYYSPKPSRGIVVGDHWHINKGRGKERSCDEVIWDADFWHLLVEELFMLPDDDADRFEIFIPPKKGLCRAHKEFGKDIAEGAKLFKEQIAAPKRSKKPRFVNDHWWDCLAMALVAKSVESHLREIEKRQSGQRGWYAKQKKEWRSR